MATPHHDTTTPQSDRPERTVPVGRKDPRSMNRVLAFGVGAFAIFAVIFVVVDVLNGAL